MTLILQKLIDDRVLAPVHQAFADLVRRLDGRLEPAVSLAAAVVSDQMTRGHVCFDLSCGREIAFSAGRTNDTAVTYDDWPETENWIKVLKESPVVTEVDCSDGAEDIQTPLVLDIHSHRLYLARYWYYQQRMARNIASRLTASALIVSEQQVAAGLKNLFPNRSTPGDFGQCLAVAHCIDRKFSVITGGPGTGKTTTVTGFLALRLMLDSLAGKDPADSEILVMAPTGKAAHRLNESMRRAAQRLGVDSCTMSQLEQIEAGTIHRLLGWTLLPPERGGPFRHDRERPLSADVVLVDEASMVDLGLMCRLLEAIPDKTQVVLIGDRDQLASVEAGGVLSDLCGDPPDSVDANLSEQRCEILSERMGLDIPRSQTDSDSILGDAVITLHYSHRFDPTETLGKLAARIRTGDANEVIAILSDADPEQVEWIRGEDEDEIQQAVADRAVGGFAPYLQALASTPTGTLEAIHEYNRFRILCVHHAGGRGDARLNRLVAHRLASDGLIQTSEGNFIGRPLMVRRNDYRQNLFNGDVGLVVRDPDVGDLSVLFDSQSGQESTRRVPVVMIPGAVDCFAMTIHKSQGSEFHQVMVVLPRKETGILTRELLYTAVTRVCDEYDHVTGVRHPGKLCVAGSEEMVRSAVDRGIRRNSGLRQAIEGP
jgi:exodeoxyribonuclease V alpha subunit